jgi:hypothetical protein
MPRTMASRRENLLPPFIGDAARAEQRGAAIAGEVFPGIDASRRDHQTFCEVLK